MAIPTSSWASNPTIFTDDIQMIGQNRASANFHPEKPESLSVNGKAYTAEFVFVDGE